MQENICIGIATTGSVLTKTFFSVVQLVKTMENTSLVTWEGCNVHQSRTNIVREAQRGKCSHLLFIDSDMVFKPEAVQTLIDHDKDIIGVNTHIRKLPLTSTIKLHDKHGTKLFEMKDELFECCAVGTGFMLIKMSVFDKLSTPWFAFEFDKKCRTCAC